MWKDVLCDGVLTGGHNNFDNYSVYNLVHDAHDLHPVLTTQHLLDNISTQ